MSYRRILAATALTAAVLAAIAFATPPARAAEKDVPDVTRDVDVTALVPLLEKGTVVLVHDAKPGEPQFTTGIVLINAPLARVWSVVTDYDKYPEFVPNAGSVQVASRPKEDLWDVEYDLSFDILWPISFSVPYTLAHRFSHGEKIWGYPPEGKEGAFKDVRFLETFIPVDENRTIFLYTTYADLKSFSTLGKLMLNTFPELQTPILIAVCFIFPESVKERIEGVKLIESAAEIQADKVVVPETASLVDVSKTMPILERYRVVVASFPDASGGRFVSGVSLMDRPAAPVYADVVDFESYPKHIPFVKKAAKSPIADGTWTVDYEEEIEVVFSIEIEYRQICTAEGPTRYRWKMDPEAEHDVDGDWGRVEVIPVGEERSVFTSTQLSDMGSSSYFLRVLTGKIRGFDLGLRVAMADLFLAKFQEMLASKAVEGKTTPGGAVPP